jgi:hypothetical protein
MLMTGDDDIFKVLRGAPKRAKARTENEGV